MRKESLDVIYVKKMGRVVIQDNYLSDIHVHSAIKRWFLYEGLIEYKYAYIGDVDIFIVQEEIPLLEQHKIHLHTLGLPYSNIVRDDNFNMLTGLHFIETKPYFKAMCPIILKYKNKTNFPEHRDHGDEKVLFDMIKESDLKLPLFIKYNVPGFVSVVNFTDPTKVLFRPDHGVHFALFRDNDDPNYFINVSSLEQPPYIKYLKRMYLMIQDPIFKIIRRNFKDEFIIKIFENVEKYIKDKKLM